MVWNRLLRLTSLADALTRRVREDGQIYALIKAGQRVKLARTFRMAGLPWIYDFDKPDKKNPRDKMPKGHKNQLRKMERLAKVQEQVKNNEASVFQFRQDRINNRPARGLQNMVQQTLKGYLERDKEIPHYLRRRGRDDD